MFPCSATQRCGVQVWQRAGLSDSTRRDDMQASLVAVPSWSLPLTWALPGSSFQVQLEGGLGLCQEFPSTMPSALALQSGHLCVLGVGRLSVCGAKLLPPFHLIFSGVWKSPAVEKVCAHRMDSCCYCGAGRLGEITWPLRGALLETGVFQWSHRSIAVGEAPGLLGRSHVRACAGRGSPMSVRLNPL